ncbi:MAG TPA: 1-deoxy-D-xylulose-5-phosphate synthase [Pseudomonadales bacterium]
MKHFEHIPRQRPVTPLLDQAALPAGLRAIDEAELPALADQLREYLLWCVGQTGGHFGAGLGVIELTIALHYVFNTPHDRLVWDVGHQTYPHKILTGRRDAMLSLRQPDGLSGFPKRAESEYDTFGVGHSSTSISAALGMALGAAARGDDRKTVAVIGDGAMTAGMAFEALNHAAHTKANLLVVLNDNQMSISHNHGGLGSYFAKIWASKLYTSVREGGKKVLSHIPPVMDLARRTEEHMKGMVSPGTLFEELGFNYIGPLDGHDLPGLIHTLQNLSALDGPQLLHIQTCKGKGYLPAEADPVGFHAINKIEVPKSAPNAPKGPKYQQVFGDWLCQTAATDERLIGITPAMGEGSGMTAFAERFPARYHDVAIAEQHAVTLAAGLACEGMKPVVAIYSTFLQRAYDQLIHDVALQNLDVLFAIDRAGLVGEDGATHAGSFDISFLRCIPNMVVMTPSDEQETRLLLSTGFQHAGPAAVRYPRGTGPNSSTDAALQTVPVGKAVTRRKGQAVALLCFGTTVQHAWLAAETLDATLVDMRFVKPLDEELIDQLSRDHALLVTLEENAIAGGAGAAVSEYLASQAITCPILHLGLPDRYIEHAPQQQQLADAGLDSTGILHAVRERLASNAPGKRQRR